MEIENSIGNTIGYGLGAGIYGCNVVGYAVSVANVTFADDSASQSNAAFLTAGDDICAKQNNRNQYNED